MRLTLQRQRHKVGDSVYPLCNGTLGGKLAKSRSRGGLSPRGVLWRGNPRRATPLSPIPYYTNESNIPNEILLYNNKNFFSHIT
jgi:hypothetical protein